MAADARVSSSVSLLAAGDGAIGFVVAVLLMGLVGALLLGVGVFGLITGRAMLPARQRFILRLMGINEVTGITARVISGGQCLAGLGLLLVVVGIGIVSAVNALLPSHPSSTLLAGGEPREPSPGVQPGGFPGNVARPGSLMRRPEVQDRARDDAQDIAQELAEGAKDAAAPVRSPAEPPGAGLSSNGAAGGIAALSESAAPPEVPALPPLESPPAPLPLAPASDEGLLRTELVGEDFGQPFEERAPAGGVLVGFTVSLSEAEGPLCGLQPIYQVVDRYEVGAWRGNPDGPRQRLLAPAGHAVGELRLQVGVSVQGLQVVFQQVEDGRLRPDVSVTSGWAGRESGFPAQVLRSSGSPLAGIFGHADREVSALGLSYWLPVLEPPATALPRMAYEPESPDKGQLLGNPGGRPFQDLAPPGGVLVGLRAFMGRNWGGVPHALQPIYQVQDRYVLGTRHGQPDGTPEQVLARPGFAVAAIEIRAGLVMNALKIRFAPVDGTPADGAEPYETDWIGAPGGSSRGWAGDARPWVGLFGTYQDDLLSLAAIHPRDPRFVDSESPSADARTWTSADGKFTVKATFVRRAEESVLLRREDGRELTVPLRQLSEPDRDYVRQTPSSPGHSVFDP